jgi:hypothetical protein
MSDGKVLWQYIKPLNPSILTGVPHGGWGGPQKIKWCERELEHPKTRWVDMVGPKGSHVLSTNNGRSANKNIEEDGVCNVITCWSANKHEESGLNHILIDDRADLGIAWVKKGGVFIHHTSAEQSIEELKWYLEEESGE